MGKLSFILLCTFIFLSTCFITTTQGTPPGNEFRTLLKRTKREKLIAPSVKISSAHTSSSNHYPIVLVHGLAGWGRNEMLGFRYWGGLHDIEKSLTQKGVATYTAAVGPISSNWDRAAELFAQIKGGRVDYGLAHSLKHNHARFGRTYPGFLSKWGEINPVSNKMNKVHLLGHSMGGQTIRCLDQLLMEGDADERQVTLTEDLSELFDGNPKPWISSITTIASPHNGSTYVYKLKPSTPFIKKLIGFAASATGSAKNPIYDFKLDQWGLKQNPNETFTHYSDRIGTTLNETLDLADQDLSPEGARELNKWVKIHPDKYYFSISAEQTYRDSKTGHYRPQLFMNPLFYVPSTYIGSYEQNTLGMVTVDSTWWENDGLVPTNSMEGPSTDPIVQFSGGPKKGKWNHLGTMHSFDHLDLIGIGARDMRPWYRTIAELLTSLPAS